MGENILKRKGLRPNWDEHNAAKCPIINYFADRNNTALILTKQENEIGNTCYFCNVADLKNAEPNSKDWVFGQLTSM